MEARVEGRPATRVGRSPGLRADPPARPAVSVAGARPPAGLLVVPRLMQTGAHLPPAGVDARLVGDGSADLAAQLPLVIARPSCRPPVSVCRMAADVAAGIARVPARVRLARLAAAVANLVAQVMARTLEQATRTGVAAAVARDVAAARARILTAPAARAAAVAAFVAPNAGDVTDLLGGLHTRVADLGAAGPAETGRGGGVAGRQQEGECRGQCGRD